MKIIDSLSGRQPVRLPTQLIRIMKITTLIMTIFLLQVSAATKAQITLNARQQSLTVVLKSISKQSGYDFIYSDNDLKNAKPVNIKLDNAGIDEALKQCFDGQPLIYEISDKTVMVRKKEEKSVLDHIKEYFTARDITGIILDEKGQPLPGATVKLKNGNKVTTTDEKGMFRLKNLNEDDILIISFIGYKNKEVPVNTELIISLELSSSQLDQVQIEAYGRNSKRTSVNDITTIKGADFENHPIDNPLKAMEGRVPGLIITPASGLPGAAMTLQLRGQNSLTGAMTEPLIILDGVPISNNVNNWSYPMTTDVLGNESFTSSLSFINPADIESIDVLKDADATSIYGSKGANGVILITTKKGKAGDTRINISSYTGFSKLTKEISMMNTQQYLQLRRDGFIADGNPVPTDPHSEFDLTLWDQNRNTDWQKLLMGKNAFYNRDNASISGGNALMQYMVSANYGSQTYVFPGPAKFQTGGAHFNITGASRDQKFHASLTGSYTGTYNPDPDDQSGTAATLSPNAPALYKPNGELNWEPGPTGYATWLNPLGKIANQNYSKAGVLTSSLDLSYKISPSFMLRTSAGITSIKINGFNDQTAASQDPAAPPNIYSSFFNNSSDSWKVEPQVVYTHAIMGGLLNVIAGASLDQQSRYNQVVEGVGYQNDALLHNLASAGGFFAQNSAAQYRSEGIYARATYNWADKYLLSANVRRDGSSRFGPGNQFGNFVSGGIGWVFSNETFIKKVLPFISFGKLRASLGTSGNDGIGDYRAIAYYNTVSIRGPLGDQPVNYQGISTLYSAGPNNPDIHWETVTKLTLGFDLGFFSDRILLTGNYFRNRSSDQLLNVNLPATTGGTSLTINMPAKIQNMGGDLTINTKNIAGKNFSWFSSGTIYFQRNKLLSLPAGNYTSLLPIFAYYRSINQSPVGKAFNGVTAAAEARGVDPATGLYMFTGDGGKAVTADLLNPNNATLVTTNPQFNGSLGNTFRYRNFSLNVFLRFTKQNGLNYLYQGNGTPPGTDQSGNGALNINQPQGLLNYWKKPGDIVPIERISAQGSYTDPNTGISYDLFHYYDVQAHSTAGYTDASFIRVQSVAFSYSIPENWAKRIGVRNLRFSLSGENLWTITGYKGFDPETQNLITLPPLRTITAGFDIGL